MVRTAFRDGLAAVRAAGWRAYAVAAIGYAPVVLAEVLANVFAIIAALVLQVITSLALIRLLGAWRSAPIPAPPQVDDEGRRVLTAPNPGPPLSDADRRIGAALRNAFALARPAMTLTGLFFLAQFAALLTVVAVSGGKAVDYSPNVLLLSAVPINALYVAFIAVAPQRVALEGETRVLVAAAHAVRVARTAYGLLLLVVVVEPLVTGLASLAISGEDPPVGRVALVAGLSALVAAGVQVVTTAVANEVYINGPRLELPVDPRRDRA